MSDTLQADALIFDFDGTLVDSLEDITAAVNFALENLQLPAKSAEEVKGCLGGGTENMLGKVLGSARHPGLNAALELLERYQSEHPPVHSRPYPHVHEVLEFFRNKPKAIVSNGRRQFVEIILKRLRLIDYFEIIVGGEDRKCRKPSPCPIFYVTHLFNMSSDRVMMIGDMDYDIQAGKQAGALTCAVTYGFRTKEDLARLQPDFLIDDLIELTKIVR